MQVRPLSVVPRPILWVLSVAVVAQLIWHASHPLRVPAADQLPAVPGTAALGVLSLGDRITSAKLVLLYLQCFDNQPGTKVPFRSLDYHRVEHWLDTALTLDQQSLYPLFLANRIYGSVNDPVRQELMFDFVYRRFHEDPNRRWESLAGAAIMARHQLDNLPLAEHYAAALRTEATGANVPDWAKQMDIFMLEEMGEDQQALTLLDQLLNSGTITSAGELKFLQSRRVAIADRMFAQR